MKLASGFLKDANGNPDSDTWQTTNSSGYSCCDIDIKISLWTLQVELQMTFGVLLRFFNSCYSAFREEKWGY